MTTMSRPPLLTTNDLCLAMGACALAIAWHRGQPRTSFQRREIANLKALIAKLGAASDHLNPYSEREDMPPGWGDDPIYGPLDEIRPARTKTHKEAA